jgi:hypothetical protein
MQPSRALWQWLAAAWEGRATLIIAIMFAQQPSSVFSGLFQQVDGLLQLGWRTSSCQSELGHHVLTQQYFETESITWHCYESAVNAVVACHRSLRTVV